MLIGALVTFLVVILILYLINLLPIDGRAKQICRVVVIILGGDLAPEYIAVFLGRWSKEKPRPHSRGFCNAPKGVVDHRSVVNQSSTSFRTWSLAKP